MCTRLMFSLVTLMACLFLQSCGVGFITYNQMGQLHKGDSPEVVESVLDMDSPDYTRITGNGIVYTIRYYPLNTGYAETTHTTSTPGAFGTEIRTKHTKREFFLNRAVVVYKNDRLLYWGMMGELSKSEDPEVAELAPQIVAAQAR